MAMEKMPKPFRVKWQFRAIHERADAVFLRFGRVLCLVQFLNPPSAFLSLFEVKESSVQDVRLSLIHI